MHTSRIIALCAASALLVSAVGQAAAAASDSDDLVEFSISKKDEKGPVVQLRTAPQVKLQPARKVTGPADPASLHMFTPRVTATANATAAAAASPLKALPMAGGITPRYAEGAAAVRYGTVTLGVGSAYSELPTATAALFSPEAAQAMAQRNAKMGVLLGYGAFNLGGAMVESRDGMTAMKGFEGSLSYLGESWGASLTFGGYKNSNESIGGARRHYGVDLGASYRISRALRLQGGVKLFDNPSGIGSDGLDPSNPYATGVYLGTRLSF